MVPATGPRIGCQAALNASVQLNVRNYLAENLKFKRAAAPMKNVANFC